MNKKIHAVCMFHFISGAFSILCGFEHKITPDVDATDRLVKFYQRATAPKIWSQMSTTFESEQIDLCENVYSSFANKNNEAKPPKFKICPEDESADSNEYIHAWDNENRHSFSVNVLCCLAYAISAGQDALKYYLAEAENDCIFVFLEVENESDSAADEEFNEEKEETADVRDKLRRNDTDDNDESKSDEREKVKPVDGVREHLHDNKLNNDADDDDDNGTHRDEREQQTPVVKGTVDLREKLNSSEGDIAEKGKKETSDDDSEEAPLTTVYEYRLGPHLSKLKNDHVINATEKTSEVTIDLRYEACPQYSEEIADDREKSPQNDGGLLTKVMQWVVSAFQLRTHTD